LYSVIAIADADADADASVSGNGNGMHISKKVDTVVIALVLVQKET
jgi:hypothetical protein